MTLARFLKVCNPFLWISGRLLVKVSDFSVMDNLPPPKTFAIVDGISVQNEKMHVIVVYLHGGNASSHATAGITTHISGIQHRQKLLVSSCIYFYDISRDEQVFPERVPCDRFIRD